MDVAKYMYSAKFEGCVTKLRKNQLQRFYRHLSYLFFHNFFSKHSPKHFCATFSKRSKKQICDSCVTKLCKNQVQKTL